MKTYIVLYEHYLNDHKIDVVGVYSSEEKANSVWESKRKNMKFRDECWIVEKIVE
ncbi:DUF7336 domain-containing protein [Heyndrickxia camelliae]|uniref:DUF7336 domain-containing protein n=1 Tax=Heyndrickxia camelliae TaxID=1707093 RepID=UPI0013FD5183|nr:hypothetical protein [Heyndrickxia camelliae]